MWTEFKKEEKFSRARYWKDVLESEGIPTLILPPKGEENGTYQVYVPADKLKVVREVLKRLQ